MMLTIEILPNDSEWYSVALDTLLSNGATLLNKRCLLILEDEQVLPFVVTHSPVLSIISRWEDVRTIIDKEIERKGICYCPHFEYARIEKALKNLPRTISPDGIFFKKEGSSISAVVSPDDINARQTLAVRRSLHQIGALSLCKIKQTRLNKLRKMCDKCREGYLKHGISLS